VAPEPAVEFVAPEPEPVVAFTPPPVADGETGPVATSVSLDDQLKFWLQRLWAFIRRRRRLFLAAAIVVVTIALVIGPALARSRRTSRWERCVERVMGHDVHAGDRISAAAVDACGLTPADLD
jgi:hypothetical protein